MSRLLLPVLVVCSLTACEKADLNEKKKDDIQQWSGDDAFADQYFVDDLSCQTGTGAESVGSSSVHYYQFGESGEKPFDFSTFGSSSGLSGPGFTGTYYDFAQVDECTRDGDDSSCGDPKVTSEAKKLKICRSNDSYPRLSVEGIALTSLANLSQASEYYKKVPGRSPTILSANVIILPKVEHVFPSGSLIDTDNLAYTPKFGPAPAFIIYPKSARAVKAGRWTDVNLWEAPWGLAHEFGHHVFRTHTGVTGSPSGIAHEEGLGKIVLEKRQKTQGFGLAGTRSVTAADQWSAVNEGYADLYAFYAFGARPGLAKGLDCFEQNREVTADSFTMGIKKRLDSEVMATYLSTEDDGGSTCDAPSLQDAHTIGAIVAHGVDALFSAKAGAAEGEEAALKKAEMLLQWANAMGVTAASGEAITVDRLVRDALKVASDDGVLSQAACDTVRANFPAFADAWLTSTFTCK